MWHQLDIVMDLHIFSLVKTLVVYICKIQPIIIRHLNTTYVCCILTEDQTILQQVT